MDQLFLYTGVLLLVVFALFLFYRLTVERGSEKASIFYNLGIPCPDGVAVTPCPHCGEVFGAAATEAARLECEKGFRSSLPGSEEAKNVIDMVQRILWNVVCPSCGRQSGYVPQAKILLHHSE